MPRGNPSPKLAITVDPEVHARVVAAAEAEGVSVSAWMTAAARHALKLREGLMAVAEWEAEHGAFTPEELDAARRRVGIRPRAAISMTAVVYDAAVLVAADRNTRSVWVEHRVRLEAGIVPVVPSPVVVQVSRSPTQVQLRRLLRGCEVVSLTEQRAHSAGRLLGRIGSRDVVDAVVADTAAELRADVVTGDRADIRRLLDAADASGRIIDV